jgi:formamidopyrimidine-DNA glycosylase
MPMRLFIRSSADSRAAPRTDRAPERMPTYTLTPTTRALSARMTTSVRCTAGERARRCASGRAGVGGEPGASTRHSRRTSPALSIVAPRPHHSDVPELPEVAQAAAVLERAALGRAIVALRLLHPSLVRGMSRAERARVAGRRIMRVARRGKHQLLVLDDASALHVHFRMSGDWHVGQVDHPLPRYTRAALDLDDGARISLVDPRALATLTLHRDASAALPVLGPEPQERSLHATYLRQGLARRRGAIKPALLDQRLIAGLGNIYAAEALWLARINPVVSARSLSAARVQRLIEAIRETIRLASAEPGRYSNGAAASLAVYDREGAACPRCSSAIRRIIQAGRSTYYCAACQRR